MGQRQTSIDCYNQIKAEGLLSKRRFQTFEALSKIAPCSASEVQNSMDYEDGGRDCMKRLSELRDRGVIYESGVKKCSITEMSVIEWDLTDALPIKLTATLTIKQQKVAKALSLIESLGKRLTEPEKAELRAIWHLVKKI